MEKEDLTSTADLDAALDAILLIEDSAWQEGFLEGVEAGERSGLEEGQNLGISKGSEIGSELGFYKGLATAYVVAHESHSESSSRRISLETSDKELSSLTEDVNTLLQDIPVTTTKDKALKPLKQLLSMIEIFPNTNIKDQDILEQLQQIRAKFKLVCAILKIETSFGAKKEVSF